MKKMRLLTVDTGHCLIFLRQSVLVEEPLLEINRQLSVAVVEPLPALVNAMTSSFKAKANAYSLEILSLMT